MIVSMCTYVCFFFGFTLDALRKDGWRRLVRALFDGRRGERVSSRRDDSSGSVIGDHGWSEMEKLSVLVQ